MWVKLDDSFPSHPKILGLSDAAFRQHVVGLCYAGQHMTDGFVPAGIVKARLAGILEAAGLWDLAVGGWLIHDFLLYNPSRADVVGSRDSSAERMREVRANTGRTAPERSHEVTPTRPDPSRRSSKHFPEFWSEYPRQVGKRTALTAFERACRRAEPEAIIDGARRLAAGDLPELRFIPHPTTWLNRDGWLDDDKARVAGTDAIRIVGTPEYEAAREAEWRRLEAAE